jgi:hypothetical protein
MDRQTIRIGGASAAWGDTVHAARQLVEGGQVDILTGDYLAEVTMALLARARMKDPGAGYVPDWLDAVGPVLAQIKAQGIRLVTNAGGMNPEGLAAAFRAQAAAQGLAFRVSVVTGDDLMPDLDRIRAAAPRDMATGDVVGGRLASCNAYLGAGGIAAALDAGAEVVITGRVVDSALVLGPLIHAFGWGKRDWDRLAQGALAGHVIECGAHATGGLFTDWRGVAPGWDDMGFPVVEVARDGGFVVEKPPGTGGLVGRGTVAEQIVYEIGDPRAYRLPDVCCDFSQVRIEQIGPDRVRVTGARGRPPGPDYKVCATVPDGFRLLTTFMIAGFEAADKGRAAAQALVARTRRLMAAAGFADYRAVSIEVIGAEDSWGAQARAAAREVVVKIGVRHDEARALQVLAREFAHPGVAMAQGITGALFGRPRPAPVLRVVSFRWPKDRVTVRVDGVDVPLGPTEEDAQGPTWSQAGTRARAVWPDPPPPGPRVTVPLRAIAWGRSGDKGDDANIGLIARAPAFWPVLCAEMTESRVAQFFAHYINGGVERFDLPGFHALNFLLRSALDGGGSAGLRYDPQAKTFAQMLLDAQIEVPADWVDPGGPLACWQSPGALPRTPGYEDRK